jgi:hypothetical protein
MAVAQSFEAHREPVGKRICVRIALLNDLGDAITGRTPHHPAGAAAAVLEFVGLLEIGQESVAEGADEAVVVAVSEDPDCSGSADQVLVFALACGRQHTVLVGSSDTRGSHRRGSVREPSACWCARTGVQPTETSPSGGPRSVQCGLAISAADVP